MSVTASGRDREPRVSIILPVYRDAHVLGRTLSSIAVATCATELIVSATAEDRGALAPLRAARPDVVWIDAPRGRARQMNAGAAASRGDWLLFLHADTQLPPQWPHAIDDAERAGAIGGCFRFALDSPHPFARAIELGVRLRVALFRLPYGDQALFVRRAVFESLGGYTDVPIMEDVDFVRRLRVTGRLMTASYPAVTSARRWERDGWIHVTARHLLLILLYFAGVPPERLK
jgi:rSAM/selenodomain-associated transferase 2